MAVALSVSYVAQSVKKALELVYAAMHVADNIEWGMVVFWQDAEAGECLLVQRCIGRGGGRSLAARPDLPIRRDVLHQILRHYLSLRCDDTSSMPVADTDVGMAQGSGMWLGSGNCVRTGV